MIEKKGARKFARFTFYRLIRWFIELRKPTSFCENSSGTKHELQLLYQSVKTSEYQLLKTKAVTT